MRTKDREISTKVILMVVVTVLLFLGKVDQTAWMEVIFAMAGLRTAQQVITKHIEKKR